MQSSLFSLDILFVPVVWGFLIPLGELLFNRVAKALTEWENWRTVRHHAITLQTPHTQLQRPSNASSCPHIALLTLCCCAACAGVCVCSGLSQPSLYQNQLIVKIFSFRFLNSFLALYYYAFGDLGILRLMTSVASFLIIGSAFRFCIYWLCPFIHRQVIDRVMERRGNAAILAQQVATSSSPARGRAARRPLSLSSGWRESCHLHYDTFEDYCALVIQFGYIAFFSVAFPLAPLCALLTNIIEIRAGAYKLLRVYRRPLAVRSPGIGVWLAVLQVMSVVAVLTNCALIGFASDQVDNWVPNVSAATKIVIIFVFEHVVIAIKLIVHVYLFSVPRSVQLEMQREKWDNDRMHRQWMEVKRKEKHQLTLQAADRDANKQELGE